MKTRHVIVATKRFTTVVEADEGKRSELEALQAFAAEHPNCSIERTYPGHEFGTEQAELWRIKGFIPLNGEKLS